MNEKEFVSEFESKSGLKGINWEIVGANDNRTLVIKVASPADRLYEIIENISKETNKNFNISIKQSEIANLQSSAEVRLFIRNLSESLTVSRHTFGEEFLLRYTASGTGAEDTITAFGNHVVYGRRGSGKSSLLRYCEQIRKDSRKCSSWIDMQTYSGRTDTLATIQIISNFISDLEESYGDNQKLQKAKVVLEKLESIDDSKISDELRKSIPYFKSAFSGTIPKNADHVIFLDDFHVVGIDFQPIMIGTFWDIIRGTKACIKVSAIESFSKFWIPSKRIGMEGPHDLQSIKLDYNLTNPEAAKSHIESILNAHAKYSCIPSARSLVDESNAFDRLVWVSAGVPRDALYLFSQALQKAVTKKQKVVALTNLNIASSESVTIKMRDIEIDATPELESAKGELEKLKDFCISKIKTNAFLVEIKSSNRHYKSIRKLIDLRFLHVISEGITPKSAGRKYLALILDYGFYTGIRAAKSVELFNKDANPVKYSELRKLKVYDCYDRAE